MNIFKWNQLYLICTSKLHIVYVWFIAWLMLNCLNYGQKTSKNWPYLVSWNFHNNLKLFFSLFYNWDFWWPISKIFPEISEFGCQIVRKTKIKNPNSFTLILKTSWKKIKSYYAFSEVHWRKIANWDMGQFQAVISKTVGRDVFLSWFSGNLIKVCTGNVIVCIFEISKCNNLRQEQYLSFLVAAILVYNRTEGRLLL